MSTTEVDIAFHAGRTVRRCDQCQNEFRPRFWFQRFCKQECSKTWWQDRNAPWLPDFQITKRLRQAERAKQAEITCASPDAIQAARNELRGDGLMVGTTRRQERAIAIASMSPVEQASMMGRAPSAQGFLDKRRKQERHGAVDELPNRFGTKLPKAKLRDSGGFDDK
jgi:hypothetical protein